MAQEPAAGEITELLRRMGEGDRESESSLYELLYADLHRAAGRAMRGQRGPGHTLQTTALVHEAYLKVFRGRRGGWKDRRHFLASAVRAMRCILVDHARRKRRRKRTAPGSRVALDDVVELFATDRLDLSELDVALDELAREDVRAAKVVELRFFGQIPIEEIATVLETSRRSVERDWTFARAWLHDRLG